ncbi:MAG: hypothetical protein V7785_12090 [Bermanella sp.]
METHLSYQFTLPDESILEYRFHFDGERYVLQKEQNTPPPWSELPFQQCSHCPYKGTKGPNFCPMAQQLSLVVEDVDHLMSHDKVEMRVDNGQRIIMQEADVQEAVGSLLGLIFASSGCPHTEFLLPMARYHLPLASAEETLWRACGSFLLAQYFREENNEPGEKLEDVLRRYQNLESINRAMVKRLKNQVATDSCLNAIVILDNYAKHFPKFLEQSIQNLKPLYATYLMH